MAKKEKEKDATIALNRRARFEYEISETFEAGLVLTGTEVKSLRAGKASIVEAFAQVRDGEAWLLQMTIPEYEFGNRQNHQPTRKRKLLLNKREIAAMEKFTQERGRTLVPMKLYWKDGRAKIEIGLGMGKKTHDKRATVAARDAKRDIARAVRERQKS